jgi:hypothetical protein
MSDIFISYSRTDIKRAREFELRMQREKYDIWTGDYVLSSIEGEDRVLNAIKECGIFLVLMTDNARRSEYVKREISYAINLKKIIIPILLEGEPFNELKAIKCVEMVEKIKLTPEFIQYVNGKLNKETTPNDIIRLQKNYIHELEMELLPLRTKSIISTIIEYDHQHDLIIESIENNSTSQYAPVDIENVRVINNFLENGALLSERLRNCAEQIDDQCEEIKYGIENMTFDWEELGNEYPNAEDLWLKHSFNNPLIYDWGEFGHE